MRATVIFDNLGPYHLARLRAAAGVVTLSAIQVSARSADYAWDNSTAAEAYTLQTLFPQGSGSRASGREVVRRMEAALAASNPEVVFLPGWSSPSALGALAWCARHDIPAVVMSESTAWDSDRVAWKESLKRRLVTLCSAALVGGRPHAGYVTQLGLTADRVFRGYDTVDNAYFHKQADEVRAHEAEVRRRHGLPETYFLASARFIEKKNLPRLLQAYATYRRLCQGGGCTPWSLVLLGDGALRPALTEQVEALQLQEHVQMPGFKQYPDLPGYYACANAFIHASTVEQWGLVVNEAMASGLPVLVSERCGCATDLVQNGRNGFTFDPFDAKRLAQMLHQVSSLTDEARQAMGTESSRLIAEWGLDRFAAGVHLASRKAMEEGPVRRASRLDHLLLKGLLLR